MRNMHDAWNQIWMVGPELDRCYRKSLCEKMIEIGKPEGGDRSSQRDC